MEYHSFLLKFWSKVRNGEIGFPSPYGVSFILMKTNGKKNIKRSNGFPSPYRVSFILIQNENKFYTTGFSFQFPSPCGVSFILI